MRAVKRAFVVLLVVVLVLSALETIHLSEMARMRRKVVAKDNPHVPIPTHSPPHATSVAQKSSQPTRAPVISSVSTRRSLRLLDEAVNVSERCPLPVLHPSKFVKMMQWGVPKPHVACQAMPSKGTASFSTLVEVEGPDAVTFLAQLSVDRSACSEGGTVLLFGELSDEQLPRMQSVMDAEMRQNELRERYADDAAYSFATRRASFGPSSGWAITHIAEPYVLVLCGPLHAPVGKELHIREVPRPTRKQRVEEKAAQFVRKKKKNSERSDTDGGIQNILHVMFDSTSIQAFRRSAVKTASWLERADSSASGHSRVFTFKHYHSVSCCSPGNQIPVYSGAMNGEGDPFVRAEPHASSKDWLWNIADSLGFTTFWSLDNCPDKSARDYHAAPSTDSRIVAPLCVAGVLLSRKDVTCLAGKTVDHHVFDGLSSFWKHHRTARKFAAVQFITPHEETEKQIIELDEAMASFLQQMEDSGAWNNTAMFFWSDHGINFGKYATSHDGEFEKLMPFAHLVLPRWLVDEGGAAALWGRHLLVNEHRLVSPYDMYEVSRSLLYWPATPPEFTHRDHNPPLPDPSESHIMASFRKPLTPMNPLTAFVPVDRDCASANIPVEFCTCVAWQSLESTQYSSEHGLAQYLLDTAVLVQHRLLIGNVSTAQGFRRGLCEPLGAVALTRSEVQLWPTEYKPPGKASAKRVWMMPNRDMVRLQYRHATTGALFEAVVSVDKKSPRSVHDLARIDRVDAMRSKCGVVEKVAEHLCECK